MVRQPLSTQQWIEMGSYLASFDAAQSGLKATSLLGD
jgi:hypothetical protein